MPGSAASYRRRGALPTAGRGGAPWRSRLAGPTMRPPIERRLADMSRPPSPMLAAWTLSLLLAAAASRAEEPAAPAGDDAAAAAIPATPTSRPAERWSTGAEVDSGAYRMSLSRGRLDMGLGFDTASHSTTTARGLDPSRPIVPALPSLSVGLRTVAGPPANSLIARATAGASETTTRRVGLEWKPVQSRVFVRGGLGLRLSGDDQVTMKLRSGRIGLYMKSSF